MIHRYRAIGFVSVLLLTACCWVRGLDPDLRRPFEVDELITVRYYTWAGLDPSGIPRKLDHISEFETLSRPTLLQFIAGLYCSLGRWPEPNNHILNSTLINGAMTLGARSERVVRVPALLGSLAFSVGMFVFCGPVLGWRWAAPLVALWAWFHPYVVQYGMTARGYSWMIALQVIQLILAYRLPKTRRPLILGVACAAVATVSILNVVSMAVCWVLPFYFALLFVRPGGNDDDPGTRIAWRRSVAAQAFAVMGLGAIFLASHLPAVYSSAQLYGEPFRSSSGFFSTGVRVLGELFPGPFNRGLALVGLVGLVALCLDRTRNRFLRVIVASTFAINLLFFASSGRFPYARAAGYLIPLVLIGAAYLADSAIRIYDRKVARFAMAAMLAVLTLTMAVLPTTQSLRIPLLSVRLEAARDADLPRDTVVYYPTREWIDWMTSFYAPEAWKQVGVVDPGRTLTIVSFNPVSESYPSGWTFPVADLTQVTGRTTTLDDAEVLPGDWLFWYPDFAQLGVDASEQRAFIQKSGRPYLEQHDRFFVKLDVYSNLKCVIFLPDSDDEASERSEVVREAIRRFGGRAVRFVPDERPAHAAR
jgi:hypothetical protein